MVFSKCMRERAHSFVDAEPICLLLEKGNACNVFGTGLHNKLKLNPVIAALNGCASIGSRYFQISLSRCVSHMFAIYTYTKYIHM